MFLHLLENGDLFACGRVITQTEFPKFQNVRVGSIRLNLENRIISTLGKGGEITGNFRLISPGTIRVKKDGISFFRFKENGNPLEDELERWKTWRQGCLEGDPRSVKSISPMGMHFVDYSVYKWNGRLIPSPIRGPRESFARLWGGKTPCASWTVKEMPSCLSTRICVLDKARMGGIGAHLFLGISRPVVRYGAMEGEYTIEMGSEEGEEGKEEDDADDEGQGTQEGI